MNNLAKITRLLLGGGKIIVVNEEIDPQFVVMNVEDYEKVMDHSETNVKGLTEEELLAKINRDIAIWKSTQQEDESNSNISEEKGNFIQDAGELKDFKYPEFNDTETEEDSDEDEDQYYFEPVDEDEDE